MIDMGDDGKIADVCAVHEDGLKLYFSIQRLAVGGQPKLFTAKGAKDGKGRSPKGCFNQGTRYLANFSFPKFFFISLLKRCNFTISLSAVCTAAVLDWAPRIFVASSTSCASILTDVFAAIRFMFYHTENIR